jgi:hypothetical protein
MKNNNKSTLGCELFSELTKFSSGRAPANLNKIGAAHFAAWVATCALEARGHAQDKRDA